MDGNKDGRGDSVRSQVEIGNSDPYREAKSSTGLGSSSSVFWKAEFAIDEVAVQLGRFLSSSLKAWLGSS